MPVTAKLSREFYERFGDKVANELVEWFNQVDATYRADLKALNELNFARFDAKLEQRLAELKAELRSEISEQSGGLFREFSRRFAQIDARVERLDGVLSTKATTTDVQAVKGDLLRHLYGTIIAAWGTLLAAMITLFSLATG